MYLSGIADEAGAHIDTQIKATLELEWKHLEARNVEVTGFPKANLHDLPEPAFEIVVKKLRDAALEVNCFGSTIGNWSKQIDQPFEISLAEARRAIPRLQMLGTKFIRIMSYAPRPDDQDQMEAERFKRLRELTKMFLEAGVQPVHENCMNYGGYSWKHGLKLLENVPGLKWVFDTANPIFNDDRSQPKPYPKQDVWDFYTHLKPHIVHVHIKDARWNPARNDADYAYPGEGDGAVRRVIKDLLANGYQGGFSIEPHLAVVFHDSSIKASEEAQYSTYIEYGRRLETLIDEVVAEITRPTQESSEISVAGP